MPAAVKQFWVVDSKQKTVVVTTPAGRSQTYAAGAEVPLGRFGTTIRVDEIFNF